MTGRKWRGVVEAAEYLGLKSPKTLYSLAARGLLPEGSTIRLGRQLRFSVEAIEAGAAIGKHKK